MRRLRRLCGYLGLVLVMSMATFGIAATANAAVGVRITMNPKILLVQAAPGAANHLTVVQRPTGVSIRDTGDTVDPGPCTRVDDHEVRCPSVLDVRIFASDGDDTVVFSHELKFGEGELHGGPGNDALTVTGAVPALATVYGEEGVDTLHGGVGFNRLVGGTEADLLDGGAGNDHLDGGPGADELRGNAGTDGALYDTRTNPVVVDLDGVGDDGEAGEGDNVRPDVEGVWGGKGADTLTGNDADNWFLGEAGDDVLDGRAGNDELDGHAGDDTLLGGPGDDISRPLLFAPEDDGDDDFRGGAGIDLTSYEDRGRPLVISLDGVADDGSTFFKEKDNNHVDVENVRGGRGRDLIAGNASDNLIDGDDGNDDLFGREGRDTLQGDLGNDWLVGESGNDVLDGGIHDDVVDGGDGDDLLDGWLGNDVLRGNGNNDTLRGGPGSSTSGRDSDLLDGGPGTDAAVYTNRKLAVRLNLDNVANDGQGAENDLIFTTVENLAGGAGDDILTGSAGMRNQLLGLSGDDTLDARDGVGNDFVDGGVGGDSCLGDAGDVRANCSP